MTQKCSSGFKSTSSKNVCEKFDSFYSPTPTLILPYVCLNIIYTSGSGTKNLNTHLGQQMVLELKDRGDNKNDTRANTTHVLLCAGGPLTILYILFKEPSRFHVNEASPILIQMQTFGMIEISFHCSCERAAYNIQLCYYYCYYYYSSIPLIIHLKVYHGNHHGSSCVPDVSRLQKYWAI